MLAEYKTHAALLKALGTRRKTQEIARFLKVHRSLAYHLKKVLDQNQDAREADVTSAQKHTKFPASVIVLRVTSSKGDVMPPHETGQRVNAKQYIEVLDTVARPWMEAVAGECPYVFQQDGAPVLTAKINQDWLRTKLKDQRPKEIWPPSSLDCYSLDDFMWSKAEREVNQPPHNTLAFLRAKILEVMADMDREVIICACKKLCAWIEAYVEVNVNFIEKMCL